MQKKFILKTVSLLLALIMCMGTVSATAGAAEVNGAKAIVDTALSQVGTYEGSGGYSKYGDYFGSPYIAWCCAFVSWCARTSGISQDTIPTNLSCTAMRDYFKAQGLYFLSSSYGGSYKPKQGDLVFFTSTSPSNRNQNNITHIGIVVDSTSSYVTCVEGNCPDRVRKLDRQFTSYIVGYATPEYTGVTVTPQQPEKEYETGVYITDEVMNFRNTPGGNIICTIPANTTLTVSEIKGDWGKTTYNGNTGWMSLAYSTYYSHEVDWLIIDISQWQLPSAINWTKLKEAGVKGTIIRIGGRGSDRNSAVYADESFIQHYNNAKAAGMYVGVYFFSYALTKAGAIEEANFTVDTLKKYNCKLDLPVYIDMEDYGSDRSHVKAGRETCSMVLDEFCKVVENAGYYAGIYVSRSFAETHVKPSVFENRSTWLADWDNSYCAYSGKVDMWQYTETGVISGAPGKVDLNRMYTNYPLHISNGATSGESVQQTPVTTPTPAPLQGDVDSDNKISAMDARLTLRYSVGLEKFTAEQIKISDVDGDNKVTAADARIILKASVNSR